MVAIQRDIDLREFPKSLGCCMNKNRSEGDFFPLTFGEVIFYPVSPINNVGYICINKRCDMWRYLF